VEDRSFEIALALAEAAETMDAARGFTETMDLVLEVAREVVPYDHASISLLGDRGSVETGAGTDLAWALDEVQYSLGDGPCLEAVRRAPVVVVEHLRHEQRWPGYVERAAKEGVRAQIALRMFTREDVLGGLNLYFTEERPLAADASRAGQLFARHAALALARARREDQLTEAIASRSTIGQAIGILMQRYGMSQERAFDYLRRSSSTRNIKLRLVAEEVVRHGAAALPDGPPGELPQPG
jgi:GAF domain-containing protein